MVDYIDRLPPVSAPIGDQTCNLGMYPDWESNLQPFGTQDNVPTNWATPAGAIVLFVCFFCYVFRKTWSISVNTQMNYS